VVYYGDQGAEFAKEDVKVSVFQKYLGQHVNACYCFGWTREKIAEEILPPVRVQQHLQLLAT
jgi:hypothetical protein